MPTVVRFTLTTQQAAEVLKEKLMGIWRGEGLLVDVVPAEERDQIVLHLGGWRRTAHQKEMLRHAVHLLSDASVTGDVFYLPSADVPATSPSDARSFSIDDIFSTSFPPPGTKKKVRYKIIPHHLR